MINLSNISLINDALNHSKSLQEALLNKGYGAWVKDTANTLEELATRYSDLLQACKQFINADRSEHLVTRLNDAEIIGVTKIRYLLDKYELPLSKEETNEPEPQLTIPGFIEEIKTHPSLPHDPQCACRICAPHMYKPGQ